MKLSELLDQGYNPLNGNSLFLSNMNLSEIDEAGLDRLQNLIQDTEVTFLDLDDNQLHEVPKRMFDMLPSLDIIRIFNNKLAISPELSGCPKLKLLILAENNLNTYQI